LAGAGSNDLLVALSEAGLVDQRHRDAVGQLRRSAEGRSVPLPGAHEPNDEIITLLSAGFAKGEQGHPAIPYARLEE
jgi:hypothetical protein